MLNQITKIVFIQPPDFKAAEKTENWMLHRKVSTTMNFIVPAGYTPDIDLKETQIAIKVQPGEVAGTDR